MTTPAERPFFFLLFHPIACVSLTGFIISVEISVKLSVKKTTQYSSALWCALTTHNDFDNY